MARTRIVAAIVGLAVAQDVNDDMSDDALSLMQLRASKVKSSMDEGNHEDLNLMDQQTPYQVLAVNTKCPDGQTLTLAQCAEALWSGATPTPATYPAGNPPQGPMGYGGMGPVGCYFDTRNAKIYFNGEKTGPTTASARPVCSVDGGLDAYRQTPAALPSGGVEIRPPNTLCDECGILDMDQCILAGNQLNLNSAIAASDGLKYPVWQSNRNAALIGGGGPRGCYKINSASAYYYYNWDDEAEIPQTPHPVKQPICGACEVTTTTTPPPIVEAPAVDQAAAVDDPHITTMTGDKFDMNN